MIDYKTDICLQKQAFSQKIHITKLLQSILLKPVRIKNIKKLQSFLINKTI